MTEHWLAFVQRTMTEEQYGRFCELWERHERAVSCPFVEAVTAEPGQLMTPFVGRAAEEVRDMGYNARVMRRSPWWDSIPSKGTPRGSSLSTYCGAHHEYSDEMFGEIEVQP